MIHHYLSSAVRHFRRHKLTTAINVVCLAIGLVCFFAVYGVVLYLQSTDTRLPDAERIVAITQKYNIPGASYFPDTPKTAFPVGTFLKADYPELELVVREGMSHEVPLTSGATKSRVQGRLVDPAWFELFAIPFIAGTRDQAMRMSGSVVVSESTAIALFGEPQLAMGRSVLLYGTREVTVTGVIGEIPQPARITTDTSASPQDRVDVLISMDILESNDGAKWQASNWNTPFTSVFARLPADGSFTLSQLRERLSSFGDRHIPSGEWQSEFSAIPLSQYRARWYDVISGVGRLGVSSVAMLYALAALVLLISCINYANLASAQAATRVKEVGMRRVVGARRGQLIIQHLCEAGAMSLAALLLAGVFALAVTSLVRAPGLAFVMRTGLGSPQVWLSGAALLLIVTLVAGAYPALVLSRVQAMQAVRAGRAATRGYTATILVGSQFAAASFLLVSLLVMATQNDSMRRAAFAGMEDPVVVISSEFRNVDLLRSELLRHPHVKAVSASGMRLWGTGGSVTSISTTADPGASRRMVSQERVHYDFFRTLDFRFLAGRDFERGRGSDAEATIIDRALAAQHGWSPQEAVGKTLYQWAPSQENLPARPHVVIGVVENKTMHVTGLAGASNLFFLRPLAAATPVVRIDKSNIPAAIAQIDAVWNRLVPQVAIKRRFADELLNEALFTYEIVSRALAGIAVLALVIAVLGLIGMSIHTIGRRTHEIGVRKTLGASVRGIVTLLLRDFSKPVIVANLIAWPLAYMAMKAYLNIFTQRVGLTWVPFVTSLALTVFIAWLAVSAQAIRAARLKPAGVLRYE